MWGNLCDENDVDGKQNIEHSCKTIVNLHFTNSALNYWVFNNLQLDRMVNKIQISEVEISVTYFEQKPTRHKKTRHFLFISITTIPA